ncbi:AMP-binding protein [Mycobacterium asiaticum]|uniref:AMP-binding protein n=1 Tax=Mycobacterium asiaticum TaxID=1790 RepID=UPI000A54B643|nr:AMP-binding protein [Mycobacterium asiaticum]
MTAPIALSRSQQNLYNGVLQDGDPALYLIGKTYRLHPLPLTGFLAALRITILENPVQLCVLQPGPDYPVLVPRLQFGDIVRVRSAEPPSFESDIDELTGTWSSGILDKALIRYTVWIGPSGDVTGLDVYSHHILLDGGATGIIEADLARHLHAGDDNACITTGLTKLAAAHGREQVKVEESLHRLAAAAQRELTDQARHGTHHHIPQDTPGAAAMGALQESVTLSGTAFEAIIRLSETKQCPLNVLVATAAVAVYSSIRQSTDSLVVHAVDNRFGDPDLAVATCLVNSVAHPVQFAPFASVHDVVRSLDRSYVKAVRRRWLREEHYRRMYLAINRTSHVPALTLNFIREACAPGLRPFLVDAPVATHIGPVEGMTVASVLDEANRTLNLAIWDRADLPEGSAPRGVAARIAAALESMARLWDEPLARTVGEWRGIASSGALGDATPEVVAPSTSAAWFRDAAGGVGGLLARRPTVYSWIAWLVHSGAVPGDVVVFTDDDTDKTIDLLLACHLAGCGYSACQTSAEIPLRASAIAEHIGGASARVVDVAAVRLAEVEGDRKLALERIEQVTQDATLAARTAYVMPTSGTTGQPKLVRVTHGSLALFCAAVKAAYGWGPSDTVLQCAPLTSDISVEEIFGATACGSRLARSAAMKSGDFELLTTDLVAKSVTVVDLPTAVWQVLSEDDEAVDRIRSSAVRQIVIGGEAIRASLVEKWIAPSGERQISLISTYGPTETTVVASYLPVISDENTARVGDRLRVGRPLVADSMVVAFGEVVVVGGLVSHGYLGIDGGGFGTVVAPDGLPQRVFATADRVTVDADGYPAFAGRRDAVVKIAGKRVDIAEVAGRIWADTAVSDAAVELHDGRLGVWFETSRTRQHADDTVTAARIRAVLSALGVSAFFVVGVAKIPRKPSGKVDSGKLATVQPMDAATGGRAAGLAHLWSRLLGMSLGTDSSLLDAGIGSLDLIRILPDTRRYLNRHLTILDLISADTAANLVQATTANGWMDAATAAEIAGDLGALQVRDLPTAPGAFSRRDAILVLGASGVLGTGFAQAVLDLKQSETPCPEVVFAMRSEQPDREPWIGLQTIAGVRVRRLSAHPDPEEIDALIRDTRARTVVNCIGNTNVVVPYRDLRSANVNLVSAMVQSCVTHGARLVHLSTYVVNANVSKAEVIDPGAAPYPYAASKSMAELVVTAAPDALDFTVVRLPRVLGLDYQLRDSADVLVSVLDACLALRAYPAVTLSEEVTTGRAAAHAILRLLPEVGAPAALGRGITVLRAEAVTYAQLFSEFVCAETDIEEWKTRLDQSDWAGENPRRWSVVDAWVSLGMMLGERSYREYLTDSPTVALQVERLAEIAAPPTSLRTLLGAAVTVPVV